MISRELMLASCYAAFLLGCAAGLSRSAARISREAAPDGGELPWPQSDAAALRKVMAATLAILAVFILAVALIRA